MVNNSLTGQTAIGSVQALSRNPSHRESKSFPWASIAEENERLENMKFYGKMILHYEAGRIVLLRFEQTKKPY